MGSNSDDQKIEFQHDTDNLTVFTIILFCTTGVMFIIAATLIVFRISKDAEIERKVLNNTSERIEKLRAYEKERLSGNGVSDVVNDGDHIVTYSWNRSIESAMEDTVREYSR